MANEVFISYSRTDYTKVIEIKKYLDKELGIDCWMDLDGIESGEQFKNVIISAINNHHIILFMMTTNSMKSPWALKELNFAEHKNKHIVLVDIDHSPMTDEFFFDYNSKDNIDWSIPLQRSKLIKDLKAWLSDISLATGGENPLPRDNEYIRELVSRANSLYLGNQYKEAFDLYMEAAQYGDSEAEAAIGSCYFYGKGVSQNYSEAKKWYKIAASKNNHLAKSRLRYLGG